MSRMLKVNQIFSDHMVLQRDSVVPIWGEGTEGETVTVSCQGTHVHSVVADGDWKIELPAFGAGGPYELTVESGQESIVFQDVLFGDVWLAGGQSNMEWRLKHSKGGELEIPLADLPKVRFYNVPRVAYEDGLEHHAAWEICSPETAGEFSAVGYYYAKELEHSLNIPIGIVGCNWGGTSASCWIPEEVLVADTELRAYIDDYKISLNNSTLEARVIEQKQYQEVLAEYNRKESAGLKGEELGNYPWPPLNEQSFYRPTGLYGTMIRKAAPYGVKGFIYYQGESDAHKPALYDKLLATLIRTWREDWGSLELPFLFVQLPGFAHDGKPDGEEWPLLRESQWIVTERVANTGMSVILDCGEKDDIHPLDKKPVGDRLARVALSSVYGRHDVVSSGPVFRDMTVEAGKVNLRFDCCEGGLATRDGDLIGFQVAGDDSDFVAATASIEGNTVWVWSDTLHNPINVRYAWANYPEANLVNGCGLPAGPFRTDRIGRKEHVPIHGRSL
ncbi:sialate O-acetylesterase [Cohnella sp. WQ 127256]|uniref:sialate O-acetylesterase n=1 Tax=Cohnella sp. WQ 127256 TaxID=2938790 RepID=UPI0021184E59|nr:sialate O-acetylesterase [Cohnella sp. WQ 127256]